MSVGLNSENRAKIQMIKPVSLYRVLEMAQLIKGHFNF